MHQSFVYQYILLDFAHTKEENITLIDEKDWNHVSCDESKHTSLKTCQTINFRRSPSGARMISFGHYPLPYSTDSLGAQYARKSKRLIQDRYKQGNQTTGLHPRYKSIRRSELSCSPALIPSKVIRYTDWAGRSTAGNNATILMERSDLEGGM